MFKQICRLLLHNPSDDQVELVLQQWRRSDVHRDVKITILRLANRLLLTELHGALAWRILDAAINVRSHSHSVWMWGALTVGNSPR